MGQKLVNGNIFLIIYNEKKFQKPPVYDGIWISLQIS